MSALPSANLKLAAAPVSINWAQWIDAREAAPRLGMSRDHLTRECRERLERAGAAMFCRPASGGNPRWFIRRSHDLRLAPGIVGEAYQQPDLTCYPRRKVDEAMQRKACVDALRAARQTRPGAMKDWIDSLVSELRMNYTSISVSRPAVYRWDALYQTPADFIKLIDNRGGDQKSQGDPTCWDYFKRLYLDGRCPSLAECWRQTDLWATENGANWCSKRTCARRLDDQIPPERQMYFREPTRWGIAYKPATKQDSERFAAGRCWVGDHTQLDFWVRSGRSVIRPWLTAWQDWRTRKIVGWVLSESPNSDTILCAFRAGMLDQANMGGPSELVIDNGKDYDAWFFHGQTKQQRRRKILQAGYLDEGQFRGLFNLLEIQAHFSIAYCPNGKARMERWFGTIHGDFDKSFVTYCGSNTSEKPEGLEDILKQPHRIPDIEHVRQRLVARIEAFNANADHQMEDLEAPGGVKLSPNDAFAQWCTSRRVTPHENVLELLMQHWYRPVTVGKWGITIAPYGMPLSYGATDPALMPYKRCGADRKKVSVFVSFDPADLRTVSVWNHEFERIAVVRENDIGGLPGAAGRDQIAKTMRAKHNYAKAVKGVNDGRHFEYLSAAEVMAASAIEPTPGPSSPDVLKLIQPAVEAPSNKPHEMKKAVGAETVAPPADVMQRKPVPSMDWLREHALSPLNSGAPFIEQELPASPSSLAGSFDSDGSGGDDTSFAQGWGALRIGGDE